MNAPTLLGAKLCAAAFHFTFSALAAGAVAALIFGLWYPGPYRSLAGGTQLFLLIAAVDVVMGPLLTLVVYNPRKPRTELRRDLSVVVLLQCAALAYGAWTMAAARPTHLVFEVDLFRVVTAADLAGQPLDAAPSALRSLSWAGPVLIAAQPPRDADAQYESIVRGLAGHHLAATPRYWVSYSTQQAQALARAKPMAALEKASLAERNLVLNAAAARGWTANQIRWLPVVGRHGTWITLLDSDGSPDIFVPVDPY